MSETETMATEMRSDGQLLAQVAADESQRCFEELLGRHGQMVFNVCARFLGPGEDARDAAQAVFLTLWRKARSLRDRASVAAWLHHVARNVARNAGRARALRKTREREAVAMAEQRRNGHGQWEQIKDVVDDELDALDEKYRLPILLFHLEGRSLEETAALLGIKASTVGTRLSRGRKLLKDRLVRRGAVVSVVALAGMLTEQASLAAVPAAMAATTVKAATVIAAGHAAAGGLVSAQAAALTQGALTMLTVAKIKGVAAVIAAAVVVTGSGVAVYQAAAKPTPKPAADTAQITSLDVTSISYFGGATTKVSIRGGRATVAITGPKGIGRAAPAPATVTLNAEHKRLLGEVAALIVKGTLWNQTDLKPKQVVHDGGETRYTFTVGDNRGSFRLINVNPEHLRPFVKKTSELITSLKASARGVTPKTGVTRNLAMTVAQTKGTFRPGEAPAFTVRWKNVSSKLFGRYFCLNYYQCSGRDGWRMTFTDTKTGKTWTAALRRKDPTHATPNVGPCGLKPGQITGTSIAFNDAFALHPDAKGGKGPPILATQLPPGRYTFTLSIAFTKDPNTSLNYAFWIGTITAPPVPFEIASKDAAVPGKDDPVSARRMAKLKDNLDTFRLDLAYAVRKGDREMQHVYLHVEDMPDLRLGRKSFRQFRITCDDAARIVDGLAGRGFLRTCKETGAFGLVDLDAPTPGGILRVHRTKHEGYYVILDGRKGNHAALATLRDILQGDAARAMDQVYRLARAAAANRSKPVRVGDIGFQVLCPAKLPVLWGKGGHKFKIALRIINYGKTDRWFADGFLRFTVKDAAGKVMEGISGAVDGTRGLEVIRVAPKSSATIDVPAILSAPVRGNRKGLWASLRISEPTSPGMTTSYDLAPGTYTLSVTYNYDNPVVQAAWAKKLRDMGKVNVAADTPLWTGKVTTAPVAFTLAPAGGAKASKPAAPPAGGRSTPVKKEEVLTFRRLEVIEPDALYSPGKAAFFVCRNQEEMKRLPWCWAEEIRLTEKEAERLKTRWIASLKIDFKKDMVLAAFKGKSPPQDYRIQNVAVRNQTVRVDIQSKKAVLANGKRPITYPYDLVACQRRDLPVVFYLNGTKVAEVPFVSASKAAAQPGTNRSKPVRVGDIGFEAVCPPTLPVARRNQEHKFNIALRITNHGKTDRWFGDQGLTLTIKDAAGKVMRGSGGMDRPRGWSVIRVAPGGSAAIDMPAVLLPSRHKNVSGLRITPTTGGWLVYGLTPGAYTLSLTYKNDRRTLGASLAKWVKDKQKVDVAADTPLWTGKVTTAPIAFTIGPAGGAKASQKATAPDAVAGTANATPPVILEGRIVKTLGGSKYYYYDVEVIKVIKNSPGVKLYAPLRVARVNHATQPRLNKTYILDLDYYNPARPEVGLKIVSLKEKGPSG